MWLKSLLFIVFICCDCCVCICYGWGVFYTEFGQGVISDILVILVQWLTFEVFFALSCNMKESGMQFFVFRFLKIRFAMVDAHVHVSI